MSIGWNRKARLCNSLKPCYAWRSGRSTTFKFKQKMITYFKKHLKQSNLSNAIDDWRHRPIMLGMIGNKSMFHLPSLNFFDKRESSPKVCLFYNYGVFRKTKFCSCWEALSHVVSVTSRLQSFGPSLDLEWKASNFIDRTKVLVESSGNHCTINGTVIKYNGEMVSLRTDGVYLHHHQRRCLSWLSGRSWEARSYSVYWCTLWFYLLAIYSVAALTIIDNFDCWNFEENECWLASHNLCSTNY